MATSVTTCSSFPPKINFAKVTIAYTQYSESNCKIQIACSGSTCIHLYFVACSRNFSIDDSRKFKFLITKLLIAALLCRTCCKKVFLVCLRSSAPSTRTMPLVSPKRIASPNALPFSLILLQAVETCLLN
jgi:hypothetical protein